MKNFVIGSGVISLRYKNGVITCTDTQASYGNLCKFNDVRRIFRLSSNTLISLSGEISDIQFLMNELNKLNESDPVKMSPRGYLNLVQGILYNKRSRVEPLNVSVSIVGVDDDDFLVSCVNHLGNFYEDNIVCTGLSNMIALPFLRTCNVLDLERDEAISLVEKAMTVMCYRSCRSSNRIQIGVVEKGLVDISDPYVLNTDWQVGHNEEEIVL
uniref:Proteasome subunit beta type-7 n=1 Tax=Vairimorpha necatrix TaxID=6039 RepID=UPI002249A2DC|nr:Chain M, Proteasome subunit beta type-7 [Vairimorpha necatrix]8ADN_a Chain a, Proteasome subunit beta type-7 [Vairimorpha necatrix]